MFCLSSVPLLPTRRVSGMCCFVWRDMPAAVQQEIIVSVIGFSRPDLIRASCLIHTILYYQA